MGDIESFLKEERIKCRETLSEKGQKILDAHYKKIKKTIELQESNVLRELKKRQMRALYNMKEPPDD